ncbi:hypothetical protein [Leucobacter chromiireducens]|uniref:Uncharacterized protein n=1 Tax=Leucobacter chromiireducens subsp. chromiireducens TaxID=660067 RepID=A0ABS1SQX1_9MICO|nr:hypothetical protein [Leucobacter chromiireducens]MBL3689507.1 hypothetical protein [Leucobacter chromiireducens subsp. chromiireducens]
MSIDYAALDAADDETIDEQEDDFMPQEAVPAQPAAPAAAPAAAPRKRASKRALTEDERLERALAQVETLRARVTAKREERRSRLVEDLYRKHNIVEEPGDLGEAKRISELRRALGL